MADAPPRRSAREGAGHDGGTALAGDAAAWGLIWKAVDDEALMSEALRLAGQLASGPTNAYALTKQAIQAASTSALEDQLDLERNLQREAGMSDSYKEGVAAFLEKRPANFRKAG